MSPAELIRHLTKHLEELAMADFTKANAIVTEIKNKLQTFIAATPAGPAPVTDDQPKVDALVSELADIRAMIPSSTTSAPSVPADQMAPPAESAKIGA